MLSGIRGEGKVSYGISVVNFVIEVEKDVEANVYEDGMYGFGEEVRV
jgi:hypothetical protein